MKWSSATFASSITVRWKTDRVSSPPLPSGWSCPQPPYPLLPLDGAKASGISLQVLRKRPQLFFYEGPRAGLQLFSRLEANVPSILKGLTVWAVCILPPTVFKEAALHLLCPSSTAPCLIFVKLSEVFPAHLQATWHLYRYWPHVLVSETLCDAMDCSPPGSSVCPWNSPGKNTGLFCHFLLQGIFPTQGLNLDLLHWRQILYQLSYQAYDRSSNIGWMNEY